MPGDRAGGDDAVVDRDVAVAGHAPDDLLHAAQVDRRDVERLLEVVPAVDRDRAAEEVVERFPAVEALGAAGTAEQAEPVVVEDVAATDRQGDVFDLVGMHAARGTGGHVGADARADVFVRHDAVAEKGLERADVREAFHATAAEDDCYLHTRTSPWPLSGGI
jgi:hypothetical protein